MLIEYIRRQREWSERTFGPGERRLGIIDHILKELVEVEQAATPAERRKELVDIAILALDGMWRTGATPEEIVAELERKQGVNFARLWPPSTSEDRATEHIRDAEVAS